MEKSTKIIIGVIASLCILLLVVSIAAKNFNFEGYKDENGWIHNTDTSTMYETDVNTINSYAIVTIEKTQLTNIDAHKFIETISPILNGYSDKQYTTILLGDGTGIYYPGSDIGKVAIYGEVNEFGIVTQELGQILVNGMTVTFTESDVIQSVETKNMYQYLPNKYQTDSGSVLVKDNNLYISVGINPHATLDEASIAAEEVFIAFSVTDLSVYNTVEIVVNNEHVYCVENDVLVYIEK